MKRRRSSYVALLIETSNAYGRGILQGVNAYMEHCANWTVYLAERGRGERAPSWLSTWCGDGVLARIENEHIGQSIRESGLPAMDLSTTALGLGFPSVLTDEEATVRAAWEHLRERGFQRFAYYSISGAWWSENRAEHFRQLLTSVAMEYHIYQPRDRRRRSSSYLEEQDHLAKWVARLPKPIGLLAGHDLSGHQVLNACRQAGVAVPDEVAVIGVHNDELICQLADPPLSSVVPNTHRIGYLAAEILDCMMAKRKAPTSPVLVPPLGIVARRSTDVLAIPDQDIADAVRYVHEHACEGICLDDVVNQLGLSRRTFELGFRKHLGRSPHAEVLRVQLERAKLLLADTDLKISAIAARCGFRHHEYMHVAFKRHMGQTPGQYRHACQLTPQIGQLWVERKGPSPQTETR